MIIIVLNPSMNLEWFRVHKPDLEPTAKTLLYGAVSYINLAE